MSRNDDRFSLLLSINKDVTNSAADSLPRRVDEYKQWLFRRERLRPSAEEASIREQLRALADRRQRRATKLAKLDQAREAEALRIQQEEEAAEIAAAMGNVSPERKKNYYSSSSNTNSNQNDNNDNDNDNNSSETKNKNTNKNNNSKRTICTLNDLPFDVKTKVFEFCQVIPNYMVEDIHFICTFLPIDDGMTLYQPKISHEAFNFVEQCIREHQEQFSSAAFTAVIIGLTDEDAVRDAFRTTSSSSSAAAITNQTHASATKQQKLSVNELAKLEYEKHQKEIKKLQQQQQENDSQSKEEQEQKSQKSQLMRLQSALARISQGMQRSFSILH